MEGLAGEKGEKVKKKVTTEPESHPKNFLSDMKVLTGGSEDIMRSRGKKTAFHYPEVEKMVLVFQVACKSV